jgi:hypothetical protein
MAQRLIFTVETPLGNSVFLTRDRWRQIIRHKHPALAGQEKKVRACLESPTVIRESTKEENVHMYYAASDAVHLCVVTAPSGESEHFVVTAYYTKNIKKGKVLWTS